MYNRNEPPNRGSHMKTWTPGVALVLATAGGAAAQPGSPPPAPVEPPAAATADTPPSPPPITRRDEPRADSGRPTELAFGIGLGYALPTSLQTPNTTSVRLRLASGLTFEPQLAVATSTDDTATTSTQQTELTLGSLVRYPLRAHGKVDLEAVGNASVSNRVVDPSGDNNNRTITMLGLGYGVAIGYWFTVHWNLSLTASNPLLAFSRTRQETGAGVEMTTKTTTIGLVFDPQVALMLHLYD
jgi:hypothetical protein